LARSLTAGNYDLALSAVDNLVARIDRAGLKAVLDLRSRYAQLRKVPP
jgi:hypothetical protein